VQALVLTVLGFQVLLVESQTELLNQSSITPVLYEAEVEVYNFSQKHFIVHRIGYGIK
jgi:hypothetical protein